MELAIETSPKKQLLRGWSYSSLAWEMPICIAIGYGAGHWLDQKFALEPILTVVGVVLGVAAAFRSLIRAAQRGKDQS